MLELKVTPTITLEDVTYWRISNDGRRIYFIRGLPQKSDFVVAYFPTGANATVLETAGRQVGNLSSQTFFRDFRPVEHRDDAPAGLAGKLDPETKARLERLRRGE